jgi:tetratricopeptide (TPR) repeat protein
MENHKETERSDFFDEVQGKVEKQMFREEKPEMNELESDTERMEPSGFDVEVEIVNPDSDFIDVDVDDSFLEEVDIHDEEEFKTSIESLPSAGLPHETAIPEMPAETEEKVFAPDESFDLPGDDQYLGELIDSEMVDKESSFEFPSRDDNLGSAIEEEIAVRKEEELNTKTLGDLYAEQGHYDKALEIYENLLKDDSLNHELLKKIEEVKGRMGGAHEEPSREELEPREAPGDLALSRQDLIPRLESWLSRIRAEKERRCLKKT